MISTNPTSEPGAFPQIRKFYGCERTETSDPHDRYEFIASEDMQYLSLCNEHDGRFSYGAGHTCVDSVEKAKGLATKYGNVITKYNVPEVSAYFPKATSEICHIGYHTDDEDYGNYFTD